MFAQHVLCLYMVKVDDASFAWKFLVEYLTEPWIATAYHSNSMNANKKSWYFVYLACLYLTNEAVWLHTHTHVFEILKHDARKSVALL